MNIAQKITTAREMRGFTQLKLASICKLSPAAISQFESGVREPCLKSLVKLCHCLHITPNWILNFKEPS